MRRFILLLTLFFVMGISYAQIWVQPNAVWHYDYWTIGYSGFVKIQHIGDSVIQGKSTMMFESKDYQFYTDQFGETFLAGPYVMDTTYTYVAGDTVFYLQNNQFFKLFDFSQAIGNSYPIGVTDGNDMCSTSSSTEVIDTGVDGLGYDYITLNSPDTSDLRLYGDYNTRFGGGNYLFPRRFWCDPMTIAEYYNFTFKCFQDDGMFYNPSGQDCEYMLTHLELTEMKEKEIVIYPNPTNGLLNIQTEQEFIELKLVDINGKVLLTESQNVTKVIDVSFLNSGIYFIVLTNKNAKVFHSRFIKKN